MTDSEAIAEARHAAEIETVHMKTDPAPPIESEHDALMRAIAHMTDAVLRLDASVVRLERSIGMLSDAVDLCPARPYQDAAGE